MTQTKTIQNAQFRNFTPHVLTVYADDRKTVVLSVQPEKDSTDKPVFIRVTQNYTDSGSVNDIPVVSATFGAVTGLPEQQENVYLIVSLMVAQALPNRKDLLVPDTNVGAVRSDSGQIIGTTRFMTV